ncbi:hypothetical protein DRF62_04590 [Chryseobacterium piscium]|uniref:Uncharacterized protein n=1 Tax=Chryseobacterium piscium TaxID=333702 RepID=A0A3D9BRG6_9FLAO|nr:hypothetical protein DRF62_04590 [Chryseobacterium piscium]
MSKNIYENSIYIALFKRKGHKDFFKLLKIFFVRKGVSLSKGTVFYHPVTKNLQYINLIDVLILDL